MAKPKIRPDIGSPEWRLLNAVDAHEKAMVAAKGKLDAGQAEEAGQELWRAFDELFPAISESSRGDLRYPDLSKEERIDISIRLAWLLNGYGHACRAVDIAMKHYKDVSDSSPQAARLREVIRAAWIQDGYTAKSDHATIHSVARTKKLAKDILEAKRKKREED